MTLGNDVKVSVDIDLQDIQISLRDLQFLSDYLSGQRTKVIDIDSFCLFFTEDLLNSMSKRCIIEPTEEIDEHAESTSSFNII